MSYEESYAKAFPCDKMVPGMLDPEMIEDTAKIVNEATKDKVQINLIINNNRAGGNAPLIAVNPGTPYITLERNLRKEYSLVKVDISTSEVGG